MNRNIKATYDGKHFALTAEECNTVELLSFACDVVEQALHIVAGNDTELLGEAKEAIIEKGKYQKTRTTCSRSCGCKLGAIHRNEKMSKRRAENAKYKNQEIK